MEIQPNKRTNKRLIRQPTGCSNGYTAKQTDGQTAKRMNVRTERQTDG